MRQHITYECEGCGFTSPERVEVLKCEASHIGNGLSIAEMQGYKMLKEIVRRKSYDICISKNESTEKAYDEAIDDLIKFEKEHGIKS